MSYPIIVCPTDCDSVVPIFDFDECAPIVDVSEVNKIYLATVGHPCVDWTSLEDGIEARIDNDGVDVEDIRELWVSGELPEPEKNIIEIDNDREVSSPMSFNLTAEVFDNGEDSINYDALRWLQCGGRQLMWYAAGDYLYGGNDGIECDIIADHIITKGQKEINKIQLIIKWDAKHSPERIANPML